MNLLNIEYKLIFCLMIVFLTVSLLVHTRLKAKMHNKLQTSQITLQSCQWPWRQIRCQCHEMLGHHDQTNGDWVFSCDTDYRLIGFMVSLLWFEIYSWFLYLLHPWKAKMPLQWVITWAWDKLKAQSHRAKELELLIWI